MILRLASMTTENNGTLSQPIPVEEIQKFLPHRYPFSLVDRMLEYVPGEKAVGLKNVTFNEQFFQGHFPNNPVFPGVLQMEALMNLLSLIH